MLPRLLRRAALLAAALLAHALAGAAGFGEAGGPLPGRLEATFEQLRRDAYQMELLISFGTSKGGSAGHLALVLRDRNDDGDGTVWSANFYADRDPKHAQGFYTDELMIAVPKQEYLYGTRSSLGDAASFGLDYGEVYKRSVIGIRVDGVPQTETDALRRFFDRLNDDYRNQASVTDYHPGDIAYDYMNLNCAKTIGAAFKHGAGYDTLAVRDPLPLSSLVRAIAALSANIPTEMALKLLDQWHARGYTVDVVLYKKWPHSAWVDPHDEPQIAFAELPDRFPSVLSLDYRADAGHYEDEDNLYAMLLLRHLGRWGLAIDESSQELRLLPSAATLPYAQAAQRARSEAAEQSKNLLRRLPVGVRAAAGLTGEADTPYDFTRPRP
jgi:hypothetical protein